MKTISKKTKTILIAFSALAVLILACVGATIAYYTSTQDFSNPFNVGKPGVAIQEKFNPNDHWVPGEEKDKDVIFHNTGEMDMLLRFKVILDWDKSSWQKEEDYKELPAGSKVEDGYVVNAAGKHLVNGKTADEVVDLYWNTNAEGTVRENDEKLIYQFTQLEGDASGYFYYTQILKAGESTKKVLDSVKFSTELSNDGHANSDFSNTQINLTIQGETVLADPETVAEQWPGVSAEILEKPDVERREVIWKFGSN